MSDYKRLVSYIYNYEAGIRKRNVGFSRVESKNGRCKVTIHITASLSPLESLKVYFIHRDNRGMEGIRLGSMSVKNGTGDFRIETDTDALMDSEYSLSDISGVLVMLNHDKFFGSQWDDREIRIQEFFEHSNNRMKEKAERFAQDIKVEPQSVTDMVMEEELANQIKETKEPVVLKAAETEVEACTEAIQEAAVEAINEEVDRVEQPGEVSEVKEDIVAAEVNSNQDAVMVKEEVEETLANKNVDYVEETSVMEEEITIKSLEEEEEHKEAVCEKEENSSEELEASALHNGTCCGDNYPECVRSILKGFPAVKPFPKSEAKNWVRIEPKDIGMLPVETWVLANNSFLLHGYYNYRHLIFGILKLDKGEQYVIGVPGVLQSTEQTMAGMFGFHRFLSADENESQYGSFGYWIQQIIL